MSSLASKGKQLIFLFLALEISLFPLGCYFINNVHHFFPDIEFIFIILLLTRKRRRRKTAKKKIYMQKKRQGCTEGGA